MTSYDEQIAQTVRVIRHTLHYAHKRPWDDTTHPSDVYTHTIHFDRFMESAERLRVSSKFSYLPTAPKMLNSIPDVATEPSQEHPFFDGIVQIAAALYLSECTPSDPTRSLLPLQFLPDIFEGAVRGWTRSIEFSLPYNSPYVYDHLDFGRILPRIPKSITLNLFFLEDRILQNLKALVTDQLEAEKTSNLSGLAQGETLSVPGAPVSTSGVPDAVPVCIGCGVCCSKETCVLGLARYPDHDPNLEVCPALVWVEEEKRHYCKIIQERGYDSTPAHFLGIGLGCSFLPERVGPNCNQLNRQTFIVIDEVGGPVDDDPETLKQIQESLRKINSSREGSIQ